MIAGEVTAEAQYGSFERYRESSLKDRRDNSGISSDICLTMRLSPDIRGRFCRVAENVSNGREMEVTRRAVQGELLDTQSQ